MVVDTEVYDGNASEAIYDTVPASLAYHADLDQTLMPWMSAPSYDGCTHALAWTEHGGTPGDGAWVRIGWDPTGRVWDVLVPPGVTSVDFDDLTAQIAPPDAVDSVYVSAYDLDPITSYAQMRAWNPAALDPSDVPHRQAFAFVSH
jgi:hypothetical protein